MRTAPPHPIVRLRWLLLAGALVALASVFLALMFFKGSSSFPTVQVAAVAGAAFVWLSGAFWWLEIEYPHIEQGPGTFRSRAELGSDFMQSYSRGFFILYGIGALFVTVACVNVALGV